MWPLALHLALIAAPELVLTAPGPTPAEPSLQAVSHWELDGGLASEVGGAPLVVEPPGAASFEQVDLPDGRAQVLRLEAGARVRVPIAFTSHRPGYEGRWTVVMDVAFGLDEARVDGKGEAKKGKAGARGARAWRVPLLQTDARNEDGAELVADSRKGLEVAGAVGGTLGGGTWHRIAMVVDEGDKSVTGYIDGQKVQRVTTEIVDSRWALEPEALLFADKAMSHGGLRLGALWVKTGVVPAARIAELGGASAGGLPRVEPPTLRWSAPPPSSLAPGQPFVATFSAMPAAGEVALALVGGGLELLLGRVAADAGLVHGALPPGLAAGERQIELRWSAAGASDAREVRSVSSTVVVKSGAAGLAFGQELLANPEMDGLAGWTLAGQAEVVAARGANGTALVGQRGDYAAKQTVALPEGAAGGVAVVGHARVKRKEWPSVYGDGGRMVLRFLATDGTSLGELATLGVDRQDWYEVALKGPVPAGANRIEVAFEAWERQGGKNEVAVDALGLTLAPLETGPVRLSKWPILMATESLAEHEIIFETDRGNVWPEVVWGPEGGAERRAVVSSTTIDDRHQVHRARFAGLERGARYAYRISVGGEVSPTWNFTAPEPDDAPLRVAWLADNQHGWKTFRQIVPHLLEARPQLMSLAGDIVQRGHELRQWQTEWFSPLSIGGLAQSIPIQVARGNHDANGAFAHAYVPLAGNGHWYAYTRAGVRFIVLDTEADAGRVPEQVSWLEAELAGRDAKNAAFRVVTFHKAPYSNRWDSPKSKYDGEKWVRDHLVPVFSKGKVDLVIAGHAHTYQRRDLDGVRYLVVGGAGGALDKAKTGKWPMDKDFVGHHWALMEVADGKITWTAKDFDGAIIDQWQLASRARRR
ncbi:MAG: metallophosphoesterase family protein [Deltaproteobacteria bacterium]|nr:metallophosphoesterase family protein [Deltaproteobacteria bacterium]